MTNKEKFKEIFCLEIDDTSGCGCFDCADRECKDCPVEVTKNWWNAEYEESTTKNDLGVDCISRTEVLNLIYDYKENHSENREKYPINYGTILDMIRWVRALPSVTPQVPKCKDCKWWKDSDGEYRRGCGAESQCPINRREVFDGNGYCFLFEPQESE